jgi:hypothetical protein
MAVMGITRRTVLAAEAAAAATAAVAMECAMLAPRSEVSIFPWKEPKERIPLAVRQIHSFLEAHRPA